MLLTITEVYQKTQELSQLEEIKVQGWVKSSRQKKFIDLNDGSCLANLQVVCPSELAEKLRKVNFASSLIVRGKLILTPERTQICELQAQAIEFINPTGENYPLQKKIFLLKQCVIFPICEQKLITFWLFSACATALVKLFMIFFTRRDFIMFLLQSLPAMIPKEPANYLMLLLMKKNFFSLNWLN